MGTTLGKKEEVKKSVRAKKVTAVKRVTKKPVTKKASDSKVSSTPEVVFVPGQASLRLLEKVHLYTVWYEQYVPSMMSGVAKVGGYAFIFLGPVFAVSLKELPEAVVPEVTTAVVEETVLADTAEEDEVITSDSDLTYEISTSSDEEELVDTEPVSTTRTFSPISITLHDQSGS